MSVSANYQATEKLKLDASFVYNMAEYSWDWEFDSRPTLTAGGGTKTVGAYDSWEQNDLIDSYSDLEYTQYSITLGGTYNFTDAFYTTLQGTYDIFESDEEYVYGDEDGKAFSGYVAVGYKF